MIWARQCAREPTARVATSDAGKGSKDRNSYSENQSVSAPLSCHTEDKCVSLSRQAVAKVTVSQKTNRYAEARDLPVTRRPLQRKPSLCRSPYDIGVSRVAGSTRRAHRLESHKKTLSRRGPGSPATVCHPSYEPSLRSDPRRNNRQEALFSLLAAWELSCLAKAKKSDDHHHHQHLQGQTRFFGLLWPQSTCVCRFIFGFVLLSACADFTVCTVATHPRSPAWHRRLRKRRQLARRRLRQHCATPADCWKIATHHGPCLPGPMTWSFPVCGTVNHDNRRKCTTRDCRHPGGPPSAWDNRRGTRHGSRTRTSACSARRRWTCPDGSYQNYAWRGH